MNYKLKGRLEIIILNITSVTKQQAKQSLFNTTHSVKYALYATQQHIHNYVAAICLTNSLSWGC